MRLALAAAFLAGHPEQAQPCFRDCVRVSREVGFRTLFNLTGPLCNPAGAKRQVIGLFARQWLVPVAEVLRRLGSEHVLVVHSLGHWFEIGKRRVNLQRRPAMRRRRMIWSIGATSFGHASTQAKQCVQS